MWRQYGFIVVELPIQRVNTSPWIQGLSVTVQLVKLSTFSPLWWATVCRTILTLIHRRVPGRTAQSQLMYQPDCVTDVLLAGSVKRFSTVQTALLCVLYRETETSSKSNLDASRVWFRRHFRNVWDIFEYFRLNNVTLSGNRSTKLQQSVISKGLIEFTESTVCKKLRYFNYCTLGQRTSP